MGSSPLDHTHVHHIDGPDAVAMRRPFYLALALNAGLLVATFAAGLATGSLTLISNGFHLFSDLASLLIGIFASWATARPASGRHSFGLVRAEVLGALATTLILIGASLLISYSAIRQLVAGHGATGANGFDLTVVGMVGLVVDLASLLAFAKGDTRSALVRANLIHFASDGLGWLLAIAAGLAMTYLRFPLADPIASLVISALVIVTSVRLLSDVVNVLLDAAPNRVDMDGIKTLLTSSDLVEDLHHLHVWNLSSTTIALSAHLVMKEGVTLHEAQEHSLELKRQLEERFDIKHATLEVECHLCENPTHLLGT